jgi:hypothetical protein
MTVDWDWEAVLVALALFDVLGMAEISFKHTRNTLEFLEEDIYLVLSTANAPPIPPPIPPPNRNASTTKTIAVTRGKAFRFRPRVWGSS